MGVLTFGTERKKEVWKNLFRTVLVGQYSN